MVRLAPRFLGWSPLLLALLSGLASPFSVAAAEAELAPTSDARGALLVFAEAGGRIPDLMSTLQALQGQGYTVPTGQIEISDARRLLSEAGELLGTVPPPGPAPEGNTSSDPLLIGAARVTRCQAAPAVDRPHPFELDEVLSRVERLLLKTDYAAALAQLRPLRNALACSSASVSPIQLYRLFFLEAVSQFYQGDVPAARTGFQQALAIQPDADWDRSHPPALWEVFLGAREERLKAATVTFQWMLADPARQVWVDGAPVEPSGRTLTQGTHYLQVESGGPGSPTRSYWIELNDRSAQDGLWLASAASLADWPVLFGDGPNPTRSLLVGVLSAWARANTRAWALLTVIRPGGAEARFLDVRAGAIEAAPDWLLPENPGPQEVTLKVRPGGPGRTVTIPSTLRGWQVSVGPQMAQFNSDPKKVFSLEIGGSRTIRGSVRARVGLELGVQERSTIVGLHLGARHQWDVRPFAFFVEGGLLGYRSGADEKSSLGLEVRAGTTYHLDPRTRNGVEFYVGVGILPLHPAVIGQFGLRYQRSF